MAKKTDIQRGAEALQAQGGKGQKKFPRTISISLPAPIQARLEARRDGSLGEAASVSRSEQIALELSMLWALADIGLAEAKRKLTRSEALLLLDLLNGAYYYDPAAIQMWVQTGIAHEAYDGIKYDCLDQKWGVDGKALLEKLKALGQVEVFGLLDWARQAWAHHRDLDFYRLVESFLPDPGQEGGASDTDGDMK